MAEVRPTDISVPGYAPWPLRPTPEALKALSLLTAVAADELRLGIRGSTIPSSPYRISDRRAIRYAKELILRRRR